jgi:hypothetical protein
MTVEDERKVFFFPAFSILDIDLFADGAWLYTYESLLYPVRIMNILTTGGAVFVFLFFFFPYYLTFDLWICYGMMTACMWLISGLYW